MSEIAIRAGVFAVLFTVLTVAERLAPRWGRAALRRRRWATNLGMLVIDVLVLRGLALILPVLAVAAAVDAAAQGWGVFNSTGWPGWAEGLLAVVALDFVLWAQHWVMHHVPLFWRFHRVHHADTDMDVTTALRFHPVEIGGSALVKVAAVYLIGPAVWAVIAFEVILNGTALFTHADIRLPTRLERALGWLLVTPAMHRLHHSPLRAEHDTNFGFALSLWDRLFGTYRAKPGAGTGLQWAEGPERLGWSLWLPFR
jgi:sterol desaturase/sphingolipid hydroxylase (fatty acid hydroxylase superfamily)